MLWEASIVLLGGCFGFSCGWINWFFSIPQNVSKKVFGWFVFLVLEEESVALIHLLPAQYAEDRFSVSASGTSCRLVVDDSASRTA